MWQKFINGELCVDLNSQEEINDFLNQCADRGLRWASGDKANEGVMKRYCKNTMLVKYCKYSFIDNKWGLMCILYEPTDKTRIIKWRDFMNKEFTKADLKTGDVILRRSGDVEIVNRELGMLICSSGGWNDLDDIREDLTYKMDIDRWDIIEVRRPLKKGDCCFNAMKYTERDGELVYERKEVEEMTLAQVCKLLGKEIKIVK